MSKRRAARRPRRKAVQSPDSQDRIESGPDGDWVVRSISGSASTKPYRCPGCEQTLPPATPHVVAWPVSGSTLSGGGLDERRHWHTACWRARGRRRTGGR